MRLHITEIPKFYATVHLFATLLVLFAVAVVLNLTLKKFKLIDKIDLHSLQVYTHVMQHCIWLHKEYFHSFTSLQEINEAPRIPSPNDNRYMHIGWWRDVVVNDIGLVK